MAIIPKTQKKLRETQFFMRCLSREARTPRFGTDRDDFEFYLSAFLSAGRSVTFVLPNEHPSYNKDWFDAWDGKNLTEESRLLKFMNGQRRAEVHILGADTTDEIVMVPMSHVHSERPLHPAYISGMAASPEFPTPEIAQRTYYFEINGRQEKVVDVCAKYLDLLGRLVSDFDQEFPT